MKKIFLLIQVMFFFITLTDVFSQWYPKTITTAQQLNSVSFTNANTGTVVGTGGVIFRTINGGTTWTQQTSGTTQHLYGVCFTDVNRGTVVGQSGKILRTENGGGSWTSQNSGTTSWLYGVCFTDAYTGMVVFGSGRLLRTINGGGSWTQQTSGTTNLLIGVSFTNGNTGTAVGVGGTIIRTINGGTNWTIQTSGTTNQLHDVSFTDANNGTAVGEGGKILRTTNGGTTWTQQTSGTTQHLYGVCFTDVNNGTAVGDNGTIIRTINGGTNWTIQTSGTTQHLRGVSFINANTGMVVGGEGTVLRTTNGGALPAPVAPVLVSPQNGATLVETNPLLDWDSSATAESYRIQVATDSSFTNTVYDSSLITVTQFQIPNNGLNINTTYYWRVNAINIGGTSPYSIIFHFTTGAVNIIGNTEIPKEFKLYINYPNPFNPTTNIKFDLPKTSDAKLIIYNTLGKEITTLVNEKLNAGSYEIDWDGSAYPSGVYFYKLETEEFTNTKKMVLLK